MKSFLIISILCFAVVQSVWGEETFLDHVFETVVKTDDDQTNLYYKQCEQELNITYNPKLLGILNAMTGFRSKTVTCLTACLARKFAETQGNTVHEHYSNMIDTFYKYNYGISKEVHHDLKAKMDYCYAKDQDECEYLDCLDIMKPPFSHFSGLPFRFIFKQLIQSTFH